MKAVGEQTHAHWPLTANRRIKALINLFLLPGVYSNALEFEIEDTWR